MTKAERRAFAKAFVEAMFGRVEAARAAAEKELADEGTSDLVNGRPDGRRT